MQILRRNYATPVKALENLLNFSDVTVQRQVDVSILFYDADMMVVKFNS